MCKTLEDLFPAASSESLVCEGRIPEAITTYNEKTIDIKPIKSMLWQMIRRSGREIHLVPAYLKATRDLKRSLESGNIGKPQMKLFGLPMRGWLNNFYGNDYFAWGLKDKKSLDTVKNSCFEIIRIDIFIDSDGIATVKAENIWDYFKSNGI